VSGRVGREAVDGGSLAGLSDEMLIERLARATDQLALAELYERYQAVMYGLAVRITRDEALAQDAVQEAFVGVWRNAARYAAGRASLRTWLLSITHHRAIDLLRRRRPTVELPAAETNVAALSVPDVWPEVSRTLDRAHVRAALAMLPAAQREAIELAYFSGLTQVEIAQQTGAPLGTVKSRVRLGLQQLRALLEAER
jgi:RNA polymerase sigma-70 factor (ECF subfamily)